MGLGAPWDSRRYPCPWEEVGLDGLYGPSQSKTSNEKETNIETSSGISEASLIITDLIFVTSINAFQVNYLAT